MRIGKNMHCWPSIMQVTTDALGAEYHPNSKGDQHKRPLQFTIISYLLRPTSTITGDKVAPAELPSSASRGSEFSVVVSHFSYRYLSVRYRTYSG